MNAFRTVQEARSYAAMLCALLVGQEVVWFALSRVFAFPFYDFYEISPVKGEVILLSIFLLILSVFFCVLACFLVVPFKKLFLRSSDLKVVILVSVLVNIYLVIFLSDSARYEAGGLSGLNGVLYFFSSILNIFIAVVLVRHGDMVFSKSFRLFYVYVFLLSLLLRIDGLSSALFLFCTFVLFKSGSGFRLRTICFIATVAATGMVIGFFSKWAEVPDYLSLDFFLRWVLARFSIQAEHAFTYLSGDSILNSGVCGVCDVFYNSILNRLHFAGLSDGAYLYPRSVSEALFFDMRGEYGAGSSPGFFLGALLLGPLYFVGIGIVAILFVNFFYRSTNYIPVWLFPALIFFSKGVHANILEYFIVVSPLILYSGSFLLACLVNLVNSNHIGYFSSK